MCIEVKLIEPHKNIIRTYAWVYPVNNMSIAYKVTDAGGSGGQLYAGGDIVSMTWI